MSIFTVCFTGVRVWIGIPGVPSAAATLALEEKEYYKKRERERIVGSGQNWDSPRHPGGGRCSTENTPNTPL